MELTARLQALQEVCWKNPLRIPTAEALPLLPLTIADVQDAAARLGRFAPFFRQVFPETAPIASLLESPFRQIPAMRQLLEAECGPIPDALWINLEPSALAGMYGPICVTTAPEFAEFSSLNATHLVWATGGSMVPEAEMESYLAKGKQYL